MWNIIKEVGNPKETDRYLIAYKYLDNPNIKYFIADWDNVLGWASMLLNIEIMAWQEIKPLETI